MVFAALLLLAGQLPMDRDPIEATRIRPKELARVYRYGGRTVSGPMRSLIVLREDGTATVKTVDQAGDMALPESFMKEFREVVSKTDPAVLLARPKARPEKPSTYDGVDIYLAFVRNGKEVRWSNEKFEGESDMPILDRLYKVESLFLRSRMRHDR